MPRYLFHNPEDECRPLDEGDWMEFPDDAAACRAADQAIREQALEQTGPGKETIIVRDEWGKVILRQELEVRRLREGGDQD